MCIDLQQRYEKKCQHLKGLNIKSQNFVLVDDITTLFCSICHLRWKCERCNLSAFFRLRRPLPKPQPISLLSEDGWKWRSLFAQTTLASSKSSLPCSLLQGEVFQMRVIYHFKKAQPQAKPCQTKSRRSLPKRNEAFLHFTNISCSFYTLNICFKVNN